MTKIDQRAWAKAVKHDYDGQAFWVYLADNPQVMDAARRLLEAYLYELPDPLLAEFDPDSEAAYYGSIWNLSYGRIRDLADAFRKSRRLTTAEAPATG